MSMYARVLFCVFDLLARMFLDDHFKINDKRGRATQEIERERERES